MDVSPGEIIHMDENGAVKFPSDKLDAVLTNVTALQKEEEARMSELAKATSAKEVREIFARHAYGQAKED
jgi:regulator of RNase E activity RraA